MHDSYLFIYKCNDMEEIHHKYQGRIQVYLRGGSKFPSVFELIQLP